MLSSLFYLLSRKSGGLGLLVPKMNHEMSDLFLEACVPEIRRLIKKLALKHRFTEGFYTINFNPKKLTTFQYFNLMEKAIPYLEPKTEKIFKKMAEIYCFLPEYSHLTLREFFYFITDYHWPMKRLNWDREWKEKLYKLATRTEDINLQEDAI